MVCYLDWDWWQYRGIGTEVGGGLIGGGTEGSGWVQS